MVRDETSNSENSTIFELKNNPKIVSNELDQVPKTGEHYQKRVDEMRDELIDKLICNLSFVDGNTPDELEKTENIVNWLEENQDKLPLKQISKELLEHKGKKISLLLAKEKRTGEGWIQMIGAPLPIEQVMYDLGEDWKYEGKDIENGEIGTYISFEDVDGQIKLSLHQIEKPNGLVMSGLGCHKEISFEEFEDALSNGSVFEGKKEQESNEEVGHQEIENNTSNKSLGSMIKKLFK